MSLRAKKKATKLISKLRIKKAPVDLNIIAQHLDVIIFAENLEAEISGILLCEGGERKIAVNKKHHSNRQRFTIAHELGHVCLHATNKDRVFVDQRFYRNGDSGTGVYQEEIEANAFAAALLMPEEFILESISNLSSITDSAIYKLATVFEVSEQAMTLRLVKLGHIEPD